MMTIIMNTNITIMTKAITHITIVMLMTNTPVAIIIIKHTLVTAATVIAVVTSNIAIIAFAAKLIFANTDNSFYGYH